MIRLTGKPFEREFLSQVMDSSGQNLLECLQCGKCSGSCPVASDQVGGPRRLIAKILSGMKQQALEDPTWWYCVSCGSCAVRCPVEINMYEVSTTLCEMAEKEGVHPSEPDIHLFEDLFLQSVRRSGRVHELKTVLKYNLRNLNPFKDAIKGMMLMKNGAISPIEMIEFEKENKAVSRIFSHIEAMKLNKKT